MALFPKITKESVVGAFSWLEKTAYQNADGVVAVSEAMREDVHHLYGVPYEKIRVIHNGIDLEQYRPGGPQASFDKQYLRDYLERLGWNKQPPAPPLPDEVVAGTSARYLEALRRFSVSYARGRA